MKMSGEYRIPAPREAVWAALNDPEILKQAIPGCESLERGDDDAFVATAAAKVGPVSAKFKGELQLSNLNPPASYDISGQGKGGPAGFAKGGAHVELVEDGAETVLKYDVDASVGGKLAQVGQRLIDSTAKKMADEFFGRFVELVAQSPAAAEDARGEPAPESAPELTPKPTPEPTPEPAIAAAATASAAPAPAAAAQPKSAEPKAGAPGETRGPDNRMLLLAAAAVVVVLILLLGPNR